MDAAPSAEVFLEMVVAGISRSEADEEVQRHSLRRERDLVKGFKEASLSRARLDGGQTFEEIDVRCRVGWRWVGAKGSALAVDLPSSARCMHLYTMLLLIIVARRGGVAHFLAFVTSEERSLHELEGTR